MRFMRKALSESPNQKGEINQPQKHKEGERHPTIRVQIARFTRIY